LAFRDEVDSLKVILNSNYFAACCFAAVCSHSIFFQSGLFSPLCRLLSIWRWILRVPSSRIPSASSLNRHRDL
jgi:hypothetical protein